MIHPSVINALVKAGATAEMIAVAVEADYQIDAERKARHAAYVKSQRSRALMSTHVNSLPHTPLDKQTKNINPPKPPIGNFEEVWAIYPRKEAKGAAKKAYGNALTRTTHSEILEGIKRYSAGRVGQDPKFTKLLATWLNSDCWLDQAPAMNGPTAGTYPKKTYREIVAEREKQPTSEKH